MPLTILIWQFVNIYADWLIFASRHFLKEVMLLDKDKMLKYAIDNGILDLPDIAEKIAMKERKKYLSMHTSSIWQSKDGMWKTYLPGNNSKRKLFVRHTQQEIEDLVINYWRDNEYNPTILEVFTEWNDRRYERGQIKKATHTRNLDIFKRFFGELGEKRIKDVATAEIEDFLCDCIADYYLTAKAFSNLKGLTKGFLKRAKKRGLIDFPVEQFFQELDISDHDFKRQVINDDDEVFYDDEVQIIMDYIKEHQDVKNLGIALLFVSGIRVGELVALKHEDFDGTTFVIKRTETRYRDDNNKFAYAVDDFPKTQAGFRTVVVPSDQRWILDKLRLINPFGDYVFVDDKGKRINTARMRKRLYYICKKLNLKIRSPHKIRKTYGSILLDNGMDKKMIEGQMGHTTIACTEKFYHRDRRKMDEKQRLIDSIPEFMAK